MRFITILTLFFFLLSLLSACDKSSKTDCDDSGITKNSGCCSSTGPVQIYKTTKDYSNNVFVQVSNDRKTVTAFSDHRDIDALRPVELANGYLLKRMVGSAVLGITFDEYGNLENGLSTVEMLNMVIDYEPYSEFYECCKVCLRDTAEMNQAIRENKLCNCDGEGWWIFK